MCLLTGQIGTLVPQLHVALHIDELFGLVVFQVIGFQLLSAALHFDVAAQLRDAGRRRVGDVTGEFDGLRVAGR